MSNVFKDKIAGIQDALKAMIHSNESGSKFDQLKKAVVDRIHETEETAGAMLDFKKIDLGDDIRGKIKEIGDATEVMLHLDDTASKELGKKIHGLIEEISNAYDVMIFHEKPKQ